MNFASILYFLITIFADTNHIYALVGSSVNLLCNISLSKDDRIVLIRWYKNSDDATGKPFYLSDLRTKPYTEHTISEYQGRVYYDSNQYYLRLSRIIPSDAGYYACKVDYMKAVNTPVSTNNRLHVIGE